MTKSRLEMGQFWHILPDFCTLTNFVLFLANIKFWLKWPSFCPKVSEYLNFSTHHPLPVLITTILFTRRWGRSAPPPTTNFYIPKHFTLHTYIEICQLLVHVNYSPFAKKPEHLEFLGFI